MGTGCYGARETLPKTDDLSSSESASPAGSDNEQNESNASAETHPLFLNGKPMTLPEEVLSELDKCYQGAGFVWAYNRPKVIQEAKLKDVKEGEILFHQTDDITHLYVVIEGTFVDQDHGTPLEAALGLQDSLVQDKYTVTAVAKSESRVYQFPCTSFYYSPRALAAAMAVLESDYLKSILTNRNYFEQFQREDLQHDTLIYSKGQGLEMVLVQSGTVLEVFKEGLTLTAEKGDWVIIGADRETECKTEGFTVIYRLPGDMIEKVFEGKECTILWKSEFLKVLRTHPLLKDLEVEQLRNFWQKSKFIVAKQERTVASPIKSVGAKIFTVLRGALKAEGVERELANAGEMLNLKLITTSPFYTFRHDIITAPDSVIVSTPRIEINGYLSSKTRKLLSQEATLATMGSVELFSCMPDNHLYTLSRAVELQNFRNSEYIFTEGTAAQFLFVLLAGQAVITVNGKKTKLVVPYDYLGEEAIDRNSTYRTSARALGHCICWALNIYQFSTLGDVKDELEKRLKTGVLGLTADQLIVSQILVNPVTLRCILATTKQDKSTYCVLIYANTGDKDMLRSVDTEISIMNQLRSPFLPYLFAKMGTPRHRIAVLKFEEGIRLRDVMTLHADELNEEVLRVYVGCILLALSFMHKHEILYLNLSPDSVYIDKMGLPKLIQFHGSQKLLEIHRPSLYVTPYSAPEVSDPDAKLTIESDFWSLGVLLFECLACAIKYPILGLTEKAIKKALKNPAFNKKVTSPAVSLINRLIFERDKYELTCETIMEHDWFGALDWNNLRGRTSPISLYIPTKQDMERITHVVSTSDVTLAEYVSADLGDSEPIKLASS